MKILFYIHSLTVGGAETIVTNELIALKKYGIDVVLVVNHSLTNYLSNDLLKHNIRTLSLYKNVPNRIIDRLTNRFRLLFTNYKKKWKRILQKEKPDIIHINTATDKFDKAFYPSQRIVYTFHAEINRSIGVTSKKNYNKLKRMANEGMAFFALSREMEMGVKEKFRTNNVYLIPNFVDVNKIRDTKYDRKDFLKTLNIPSNSFILGHIGRFHPVKNHERIIDIFNEIHKIRHDSYLILIGGDVDGRHQTIKNKAKAVGIDKYVKFLGVRDDATRILGCFDAMVLPSLSESFSLVLVEAQALGLRCVASDRIPEDVFCNDNCFRVPLNKPDDFWARLLLDKTTLNCQSNIDQFSLENVVLKAINAYKEIITKSTLEKNN